ncbi:MAG: hypothetical protein Ct9H90mP9_0760 [Pseudomonadota bacterium]|nr:MAG: hypothetical protein Ct9H90mP9_0760 [Pseudomonadota bacterium]
MIPGHEMPKMQSFSASGTASPQGLSSSEAKGIQIVKFSRGKIGHDEESSKPRRCTSYRETLVGFGISGESNDFGSVTVGNDLFKMRPVFPNGLPRRSSQELRPEPWGA